MTTVTVITMFYVAITLAGEELTRVGPFFDGGACFEFSRTIDRDIERAFNDTTQYGITGDMWDVGGGAILRYNDYELPCVSVTRNMETGEILYEHYH